MLPRYRLATGQKTFTYRGAKLHNSIAKGIRDTGNLNVFKKRKFGMVFVFHLARCVRRLLKSEAIVALLDSFQCILSGKHE